MKTKTLTKFKSQVLTLVLTIAALAVGQSAWADDSGNCGTAGHESDVQWSYNSSSKTLTITKVGETGAMGSNPWSSNYRTTVQNVVINEGVTTIVSSAFYNCDALIEVTIPSTMSTIGKEAFYSCDNLVTVNFNGGTTIEYQAFSGCANLVSVTIPNSVTTIGERAFYRCQKLGTINIGSGLASIAPNAFEDCKKITTITVDKNNTAFKMTGDVLFSYDGKTLVIYPRLLEATAYTIPDGVTTISDYAFADCYNLTSVTIPDGVTTIGDYAFSTAGLTSITIPTSVTSIGEGAFYFCYDLATVTIPSSVATIGRYVFDNTPWLKIQSYEDGVLYVNNMALASKDISGAVTIKSGTTTIADGCFKKCDNLKSVTIPASVMNIGEGAFSDCDGLTNVTYEDGSQLTSIRDNAFYKCKKLECITIPAGVTSIGADAFKECTSIMDVYCYADPTNLTWDDGNFDDFNDNGYTVCHVENATAWSSFEAIVNVTFVGGYCGNTAANDGKNLRWDMFIDGNRVKTLSIFKNPDAVGTDFSMADNVDFGSTDSDGIIIEEGVTSIGANAFKDYTYITSITIPASVTSIGVSAFEGCTNLKNVLVLASTPPTLEIDANTQLRNTFNSIIVDAVFTVPNDAYEAAEGWKDVKNHADGSGSEYEGYDFDMVVLGNSFKQITYIDEKGQSATSPLAIPITNSDKDVVFSYGGDTWYYVDGDVEIDNGNIEFQSSTGSTNLILCDGASLTLQNIYAENNLNIYAQSIGNDVGAIVINSDVAYNSIVSVKDITINGGEITIVNTNNDYSYGIYTENNVTINGGTITATSKDMNIYGSKITINGGSITVYDACEGLYAEDFLTVNGGSITVNDADYGLYANNYLTINDGTITANNAEEYGLYAYYYDITIKGGDITINNNEITINNANNVGTGLYNEQGDINISGGTISVKDTYYGIYTNENSRVINISGGTISVDEAEYGIYTNGYNSNINISGGTISVDKTEYGIYTNGQKSNINISGGNVTIDNGAYGIYSSDDYSEINIDNATVEVTVTDDDYPQAIKTDNLSINNSTVKAYATCTADDKDVTAINAFNIAITGDKSIVEATASSPYADDHNYGILAYESITITDATVTASAESTSDGHNEGVGIYACYDDITINNAKLSVNGDKTGIWNENDNIIINGGNVVVNGGSSGIYAEGEIDINGGKVVVNVSDAGGYGMDGEGGINLGWTNFGDYIYASSYYGTVNIANGKKLYNGDGKLLSGTVSDLADISDKTLQPCIALADTKDNTTVISNYNGMEYADVQLSGRTLTADNWNTLCLPFNLSSDQITSIFGAGTLVKTLSGYANDGNTVTITFASANEIVAGTPYIIMPVNTVANPVFSNVVIDNTMRNVAVTGATFKGTYGPTALTADDKTKLFLANNMLWYPTANLTVKACRAYFVLDNAVQAREFILDFGEETTSLSEELRVKSEEFATAAWYTLDGRKLSGKPTAKGIYIVNGHKVVVK